MKKLLRRSLYVFAALIIVLILVYAFALDSILRSAVQSTTQSTVGTTTTLQSLHLHTFAGSLDLSGLNIANPKDFKLPTFVSLQSCNVTVVPSSLLSNTVVVDNITLDGLHLNLEQIGPLLNNLNTILGNIQRQRDTNQAAPHGGTPPAGGGGGGGGGSAAKGQSKDLKVNKVLLTNTVVTIRMSPLPNQEGPEVTANLGPIEIDQPTNPDGRALKFADLAGKILVQVAQQAANDPKLPSSIRSAFQSTNNLLNQNLGKLVNDLGTGLKLPPDITKPLGDAVQQGIGDFLTGRKPPTSQPAK